MIRGVATGLDCVQVRRCAQLRRRGRRSHRVPSVALQRGHSPCLPTLLSTAFPGVLGMLSFFLRWVSQCSLQYPPQIGMYKKGLIITIL